MPGQAAVFFLEDLRVLALLGIPVLVVLAVTLDAVDEEQAEYLDAQGSQAQLLVQVFLDRPADHLALHRLVIHTADRLPHVAASARHRAPSLQ